MKSLHIANLKCDKLTLYYSYWNFWCFYCLSVNMLIYHAIFHLLALSIIYFSYIFNTNVTPIRKTHICIVGRMFSIRIKIHILMIFYMKLSDNKQMEIE